MNALEERSNFLEATKDNMTQVFKTCILQFKVTLSNPTLLFMLFLFPVILLFGTGALIKESSIFVAAFGSVEILLIGILFGSYKYSFETSTLGENMKLTNIKKYSLMISMTMTIFVFSLLVFIIQLTVMQIAESVDFIFMDGFIFQGDDSLSRIDINWSYLNYAAIFMFYFQTFILSLGIYYFASLFFQRNATFQIFILCYFFLNLTLGGIVSELWLIFNPVSSEFVTKANTDMNSSFEDFVYYYHTYQLNTWIDVVPFVLPQWFNNKHFFSVFNVGATQAAPDLAWNEIRTLPTGTKFMYWSEYDPFWNFALLAPYVYSIFFISMSWVIKGK